MSAAELADVARETVAAAQTDELEALAKAALDELRNRGRNLGIEIERDQHANALSVVERLAASARAVEQIARAKPASDPA